MLAKPISKPFSNDDWIFEIKWDGFRAIAYVDDRFSLKSRNGNELKDNFPELGELKYLARNVVVDGEIVILRQGKVDFHSLQERGHVISAREIERQRRETPATYVVFDILEKDGTPLVELPLIERKKILKESVKESPNIVINDYVEGKGEQFYKAILQQDMEGMVAKKKNSSYEQGLRTGSWLKIKNLKSCDCVIFGYSKGEGAREVSFGALVVGLYDNDGTPQYLAHVGTGFTQILLESLMKELQHLKTEAAPFKVPSMERVTWVKPKLVCEVIYQIVTRDCRLRMPRLYRLREDKLPAECTVDQIQGNGKCFSSQKKLTTNV